MHTNWLIESSHFEDDARMLIEAVKRTGLVVKEVSSHHEKETYLNFFDQNECVVVHGTIDFCLQVQRESRWTPGVYLNRENHHFLTYQPRLHNLLLAETFVALPFEQIIPRKQSLMDAFGEDGALFIRPDSPYKEFTGQLLYAEDFEIDVTILGHGTVGKKDACIVSPPRNIINEWRFVVVDREVITGSQYRKGGKPCQVRDWPQEARQVAQRAADIWQPDRVWCVDVCQTKADFYVLEINSFSTSGLYACDLGIIVERVSFAAWDDWEQNQ